MSKFKRINGADGLIYLIRKYDDKSFNNYNGSVYHLITMKRFEDRGELFYDVVDTLIPLQPSQYFNNKVLESDIFPYGRSKSIHNNIIFIYEKFGTKYSIESNKSIIAGVSKFNKYFLDKYKVNINFVLDGYTFKKKYAKRLYEDLFTDVTHIVNSSDILIKDTNYDKNCGGGTRFTLEFFNELKKLVNIGDVKEVRWLPINNDFLVNFQINGKVIHLHGLNAGYGGEGPRGLMYVLKECGFNNDTIQSVILNSKGVAKKSA